MNLHRNVFFETEFLVLNTTNSAELIFDRHKSHSISIHLLELKTFSIVVLTSCVLRIFLEIQSLEVGCFTSDIALYFIGVSILKNNQE